MAFNPLLNGKGLSFNTKGINTSKLNAEVRLWAAGSAQHMQKEAKALGITHRSNSPSSGSSIDKIFSAVKTKFSIAERISFKFPRHLVFVHKGVGKGTPITAVGTTSRKAKEWFEKPMTKDIEKLADIVQENFADAAVSSIHL